MSIVAKKEYHPEFRTVAECDEFLSKDNGALYAFNAEVLGHQANDYYQYVTIAERALVPDPFPAWFRVTLRVFPLAKDRPHITVLGLKNITPTQTEDFVSNYAALQEQFQAATDLHHSLFIQYVQNNRQCKAFWKDNRDAQGNINLTPLREAYHNAALTKRPSYAQFQKKPVEKPTIPTLVLKAAVPSITPASKEVSKVKSIVQPFARQVKRSKPSFSPEPLLIEEDEDQDF